MMELWESQVASSELVKETKESDLIPGGKYPFTITEVKETEQRETFDDGHANPMYGQPVGRLQVTLYGVGAKGYDALDGKNRVHFFGVCPVSVKDADGKLQTASKLAGQMAEVAGTVGQPFSKTIAWFKENKGLISVSQYTGKDGSTRNGTNRIGKIS